MLTAVCCGHATGFSQSTAAIRRGWRPGYGTDYHGGPVYPTHPSRQRGFLKEPIHVGSSSGDEVSGESGLEKPNERDRRRRPRILFLSQCLPFPPHSGVTRRTYHILKELHRMFDVSLVPFSRRVHQN